ncbi:hypothetical protein B7P43_G10857 [Cryptotermes secundus]|uniref:Uncharacterized protein n=1 Tax=Cryptotermes secundus TaxID=105785 RepID=A0A2J7Q217_9NEOP|nr:hypothetical protein B7P43_G10857 [Cryptotermes secundus]
MSTVFEVVMLCSLKIHTNVLKEPTIKLHGIMSQKTVAFMVTAVRNSDFMKVQWVIMKICPRLDVI